MKQFFKSTAIFACIALMFCACSDDGTEDLSSSIVTASEIKDVLPGDCQAWVKWIVPADENVSTCQVAWTNGVDVMGTATFDAVQGWMEYIITDLTAGDYTFTVQNFTYTGISSSTHSESVYVYDYDTYYAQWPTVDNIFADDTGVTISWTDVPEDCAGVVIYYYNTSSVLTTTSLISIGEDQPTLLADAQTNTFFTFDTYLKPTNGIDYIILPNNDEVKNEIPDQAPYVVTDLFLNPGNERMLVSWYVPQMTDISSSIITFSKDGGDLSSVTLTTSSEGDLLLTKGATNVYEINENLAAGEYVVTVYNEKGLTGTRSEGIQDTIYVYDENTYSVPPTIHELLFNGTNATVSWNDDDVVDCIGAIATYTDIDGNEGLTTALTPIDEMLTMLNVTTGGTFTYVTYYCPENGLDTMSIANNDLTTNTYPVKSPATPQNVEMYSGDNKILLYWDLDDDDFIETVVISYTDGTNEYEEVIPLTSLNIGLENSYSITDGLELGTMYTVSIKTMNGDVSSGVIVGEDLTCYDFSTYEAEAVAAEIDTCIFSESTGALTITWKSGTIVEGGVVELTHVCDVYGNTKTSYIDTETILETGSAVLYDVMPGNAYSYLTRFTPVSNAKDNVTFAAVSSSFEALACDKAQFMRYSLEGDLTAEGLETTGYSGYGSFESLYNEIYNKDYNTGNAYREFVVSGENEDYEVASPSVGQSITIDLGKVYKLSSFTLHYYLPNGFNSLGINKFSLYGTSLEDPMNDPRYNKMSGSGPDLTMWDCVLSSTEVLQPSLNNIDYNGDGDVNVSDDSDIMASYDGFKFDIPSTSVPVRYLRIIVEGTWCGNIEGMRINEIDIENCGFEVSQ